MRYFCFGFVICKFEWLFMWTFARINFFLVGWKLTVLSVFLHGSLVLKYADLSNQRDFFVHGSFLVESNQANTRDRKKPSQQKQTFFLQSFSLFLGLFVSNLLNKTTIATHTCSVSKYFNLNT